MPHFLILAADRPGALEKRLAHRQDHLDYWAGKHGAVKVAGAMLEDGQPSGSAFLLDTGDEREARGLLAEDPFMLRGIFTGQLEVTAIRPAIGDWLRQA